MTFATRRRKVVSSLFVAFCAGSVLLALVPLILFATISFTSPEYLPVLVKHPMGKNLIAAAVVLAVIGILWIRKIIRIRV